MKRAKKRGEREKEEEALGKRADESRARKSRRERVNLENGVCAARERERDRSIRARI